MGCVEDEEPTLKRMKVAFTELRGLSNGSSIVERVGGSSRDLMTRPLPSEGDNCKVIGLRGVIRKDEFVRIIANALYSLGYKKSIALLEEESGIALYSSTVNIFMRHILDGNWDESINTLRKIGLSNESMVKSASFFILEQKYLELLQADRVMEAVKTLRTEIAPLSINNNRIHELSSFIMSPSLGGLTGSPGEEHLRAKSQTKLLEELQKLLPPTIMIPENRLEHLVEQALLLQRDSCVYHNASDQEMSLYTDHTCGKNKIPSQTLQVRNGCFYFKQKQCICILALNTFLFCFFSYHIRSYEFQLKKRNKLCHG